MYSCGYIPLFLYMGRGSRRIAAHGCSHTVSLSFLDGNACSCPSRWDAVFRIYTDMWTAFGNIRYKSNTPKDYKPMIKNFFTRQDVL